MLSAASLKQIRETGKMKVGENVTFVLFHHKIIVFHHHSIYKRIFVQLFVSLLLAKKGVKRKSRYFLQ